MIPFCEQVTGQNLDVESENFKLRNIMEADPLKYKEEIEVSIGSKTKTNLTNQTFYESNKFIQ